MLLTVIRNATKDRRKLLVMKVSNLLYVGSSFVK